MNEFIFVLILLSIIIAAVAFGNAQKKHPSSSPEEEKEIPQTFDPCEPYRRVLEVAIPSGMKWKPVQANELLSKFFNLQTPFNLVIRTVKNRTVWQIVVGEEYEGVFTSTLYSVYPEAQITRKPKIIDMGYKALELECSQAFIFPFALIEDFSKTTSPMALTSSLLSGSLNGDKEVVLEIALRPQARDYTALAHELLFWNTGDQVYKNDLHKLATAKLGLPLMEAKVFLKSKMPSGSKRNNPAITSLGPALAQFDRTGIQELYPALKTPEPTFPLVLSSRELAVLWHLPTEDCKDPGIIWAKEGLAPLPAQLLSVDSAEGIYLGDNIYQGARHPVRLAYRDRITHINIAGRTRVGKSTLMHNMIHQDIANGKGVGVIDPHGDLVMDILACSIPKHREKDVVLFDVTDSDYPIALNLLSVPEGVPPEVGASQALGIMRKMFAQEWRSGRMENVLYAILASLVTYPGATIQDVARLPINNEFRSDVLQHVTDFTALEYWHEIHDGLSPQVQLEIAQPIINRVQRFYREPTIRRIICQTSSLDFTQILNGSKIFLANLGGMSNIEGETLGALLISKIQMAAMSRTNRSPLHRVPFYLYIDEVQNFITTSLDKIFSEAAKHGLSLAVANQFASQLTGATLNAILGNVGTTILFRCGPDDARTLGRMLRPQFEPDTLLNLDRFVSIVKMQYEGETVPAFNITTAPPPKQNSEAGEMLGRIRTASRQGYARPRAEVDSQIAERYTAFALTRDPEEFSTSSAESFLG